MRGAGHVLVRRCVVVGSAFKSKDTQPNVVPTRHCCKLAGYSTIVYKSGRARKRPGWTLTHAPRVLLLLFAWRGLAVPPFRHDDEYTYSSYQPTGVEEPWRWRVLAGLGSWRHGRAAAVSVSASVRPGLGGGGGFIRLVIRFQSILGAANREPAWLA